MELTLAIVGMIVVIVVISRLATRGREDAEQLGVDTRVKLWWFGDTDGR